MQSKKNTHYHFSTINCFQQNNYQFCSKDCISKGNISTINMFIYLSSSSTRSHEKNRSFNLAIYPIDDTVSHELKDMLPAAVLKNSN